MIAFTRDFRILASRVPTDISAVLFARGNVAKTWDVRTFRRLLICHVKSPFQITYESLITEFARNSLLQASLQIRDCLRGCVRTLDELCMSPSLSECPIKQTPVSVLDVVGRDDLIEH
jgi:hypothetical protein